MQNSLKRLQQCNLYSLDLIRSQTADKIDTVEVWGSSPHGPTTILSELQVSFCRWQWQRAGKLDTWREDHGGIYCRWGSPSGS